MIELAMRIGAVFVGAGVSMWVLLSAARTVMFPRPERVWVTNTLFGFAHGIAKALARGANDSGRSHWILGSFAPVALLALPLVWSVGLIGSFSLLYWGVEGGSYAAALELSGSSLTTLGFVSAPSFVTRMLAVLQALLGLAVVALLIGFLPTFYGTFSRREAAIARLAITAGTPPTPTELIVRTYRLDYLRSLESLWVLWEQWFVEVEETHTTFPALVYFRSVHPSRSWVTAAETMLDTAALVISLRLTTVSGKPQVMLRAGQFSVCAIARFFRLTTEDADKSDEHRPLSVSRQMFEMFADELASHGVTSHAPRDAAWREFQDLRVRYDEAICGLRELVGDVPSHWEIEGIGGNFID